MTTEYSPHDYAMEAAFFADMERKSGNEENAASLFERALELELQALEELTETEGLMMVRPPPQRRLAGPGLRSAPPGRKAGLHRPGRRTRPVHCHPTAGSPGSGPQAHGPERPGSVNPGLRTIYVVPAPAGTSNLASGLAALFEPPRIHFF